MQPPNRILKTATIYDSYLVTALCLISSFRAWIMYDKMLSITDKENVEKRLWEGFSQRETHFKVCHVPLNDLGNAMQCLGNSCITCMTHHITWKCSVIGDGGEKHTNQCSLMQNLIKTSFSVSCHRKENKSSQHLSLKHEEHRGRSEGGFRLGHWVLIWGRRDHLNCIGCVLVRHCEGANHSFPLATPCTNQELVLHLGSLRTLVHC